MLKKVVYIFTPNRDEQKQLQRTVGQYAGLCSRLAEMARDYERAEGKEPTAIDLNNLGRKNINTTEEGIPYRFVGLAAGRVTRALKTNKFYKFYDPEDASKYSVDLDEKTVSVGLAGGIKDYPKLALSIATWDGRLQNLACEAEDAVPERFWDGFCRVDSRAGYPLLVRLSEAEGLWGVFITVNDKK